MLNVGGRIQGGDGMSNELKPCPRCGAKNSHAIFSHPEKVTANGRTLYVRFVGIRCDDCGFSLDGYLNTDEAVTMWNAVKGVTE
jgi:ribosomal protein S27E